MGYSLIFSYVSCQIMCGQSSMCQTSKVLLSFLFNSSLPIKLVSYQYSLHILSHPNLSQTKKKKRPINRKFPQYKHSCLLFFLQCLPYSCLFSQQTTHSVHIYVYNESEVRTIRKNRDEGSRRYLSQPFSVLMSQLFFLLILQLSQPTILSFDVLFFFTNIAIFSTAIIRGDGILFSKVHMIHFSIISCNKAASQIPDFCRETCDTRDSQSLSIEELKTRKNLYCSKY